MDRTNVADTSQMERNTEISSLQKTAVTNKKKRKAPVSQQTDQENDSEDELWLPRPAKRQQSKRGMKQWALECEEDSRVDWDADELNEMNEPGVEASDRPARLTVTSRPGRRRHRGLLLSSLAEYYASRGAANIGRCNVDPVSFDDELSGDC